MILPCECRSPAECLQYAGGEQGLSADEIELAKLRRELTTARAALVSVLPLAKSWADGVGQSHPDHETISEAEKALGSVTKSTLEQPAPKPGGVPVWESLLASGLVPAELVADCKARDALGRERYGTPLQAHNGRRWPARGDGAGVRPGQRALGVDLQRSRRRARMDGGERRRRARPRAHRSVGQGGCRAAVHR